MKVGGAVLPCMRGECAAAPNARLTLRSAITVDAARKVDAVSMRQSVFIVDDDPSIRTSLSRLLREHGFAATLFESANALRDHGNFDEAICIVLDIDLDGASGIDLRRKLAEAGVDVPVIYITGSDSAANRAAAIGSGCIAYLAKPFSAQSLIESVMRATAVA